MRPVTKDAYQLVHEGSLALAEVEYSGMRIDTDRLEKTIQEVKADIEFMTEELKATEVWAMWKRRWGSKTHLGSRYQLGEVLFRELGFKSTKKTKEGREKMDAAVLEEIDHPFIETYVELEKKKKLQTTYLKGVQREVCEGYLHPSFNLHLARTYRSSCDSPNFQNIPIRDEEIGRLIRKCFIPRDGHVLVEVDFGALEFRVAACFWKDSSMIAYASDPTLDIHRDMAGECYLMEEVTKLARFYAKNQFVFPQLYGSYYVNCAKNLWASIENAGLETADGKMGLYKYLEEKGIRSRGVCDPNESPVEGTFEKHIKEVEESFHGRFSEWSDRKEKWWKKYQERGWFKLMTGFVCQGVYKRNNLYNTPIQGSAFHLLLWSLIQMVKWQIKTKARTRIIGQIHDSIVADVHESELDDWIAKAKQVMTQDVRDHWDWVVTPLEVEFELARTNWFEKEEILV